MVVAFHRVLQVVNTLIWSVVLKLISNYWRVHQIATSTHCESKIVPVALQAKVTKGTAWYSLLWWGFLYLCDADLAVYLSTCLPERSLLTPCHWSLPHKLLLEVPEHACDHWCHSNHLVFWFGLFFTLFRIGFPFSHYCWLVASMLWDEVSITLLPDHFSILFSLP